MTAKRALTPTPPTPAGASLQPLLARAEKYVRGSLAEPTLRAYTSDFRIFADWCVGHDARPLPAAPATVAAFLAGEAEREFRPVTIGRRVAAIGWVHRMADQPNPCETPAVRQTLTGIRREDARKQAERADGGSRQVQPLELDPLERVCAAIDTGTRTDLRDRALLLLGFGAALRRSELVALHVKNLRFDPRGGVVLTIVKSKTNQEGKRERVAVPYGREPARCPVRALRAWLEAAGIHSGPVFRRMHRFDSVGTDGLSGQSVALIVKRRAKAAGLAPAELAGHSLRAGYITAAARAGIGERQIVNVSRHKNLETLRGYIRMGGAFDDVGKVL